MRVGVNCKSRYTHVLIHSHTLLTTSYYQPHGIRALKSYERQTKFSHPSEVFSINSLSIQKRALPSPVVQFIIETEGNWGLAMPHAGMAGQPANWLSPSI